MRNPPLLITLFIFSCISLTFSQPAFKIDLRGGYNVPLAELKGNVYDSADRANTYFMNHGYNFGGDVKFNWREIKNVNFTFGLGYSMFVNTEENVNGSGKDADYKINALVLGAGIEYNFIPKAKVNPFIGVEFTGHFFSGSMEIIGIAGDKTDLDLQKASRFGFAAGIGIDFAIGKRIGIIAGSKYHLANLIGKDTTAIQVDKFALNDAEFIYNGDNVPAKTISYLQFYAGISYYIFPEKGKRQ